MLVYLPPHVITWTRFQLTQIHLSTGIVTVINVKFSLEQAIKAQSGVEVYLYSFFNLGTKWGWVANATSPSLYTRFEGVRKISLSLGFDLWIV